jgi:hypothetical protein
VAITNGYATLAEFREHIGDTASVATAAVAERAITAASRAIDKHCGYPHRRFWLDAMASAKVYRPDDPYEAWVHDIGSESGLVIATDTTGDGSYATTWDAADYQLEPLDADGGGDAAYAWWRIVAIDDKTFPVSRYRTTLQVTARWGWSAVPDDVNQACLIKAASLYERRNSPGGIHAVDGFGAVRISRHGDPDVVDLLGPYRRMDVVGI